MHEYYTARDFPVITQEAEIEKYNESKLSINPLLGVNYSKYFTATQGYSVVTNDMHGRSKKVSH